MIYTHYTNNAVQNEEGPNIFIFGDKSDWRKFSSNVKYFLNHKIDIIELVNSPDFNLQGSKKLILERDDTSHPSINTSLEALHLIFSSDMWDEFQETIQALSASYCFNYIDFDDRDIQQTANLIVESTPRACEMAQVSP